MTDKNKNILKVKKSIFIPFLEHIENIDDVKVIVKKYREKYKDSSHICWGYILNDNIFGCSDNGEPHGTAGLQILNVLKSKKKFNTMGIVVRYFGGTKLGCKILAESYRKAIEDKIEYLEIH